MMKPLITLFVDSSLFGGIESHILQLTQIFKNEGEQVAVLFCKDRNNQQFYRALEKLDCSYNFISGSVFSFCKYLKSHPNAIVHSHGYRAGITARLACLLMRRPCVSTFHAGESGQGRVRWYNWLDKFSSPLSHNFVVSQLLKPQVHKAVVLDNFVSPIAKFKCQGEVKQQYQVGFVGRLSYEKGPDIFAQLSRLNLTNNKLGFHIFGDGPLRQTVLSDSRHNLTFNGHQQDQQFWHAIDILVISSRQEGLPMVLLEAMNRGIPVITTPVGAVNKVIKHEVNGYIAENICASSLHTELLKYSNLSVKQKARMKRLAQKTIHTDFSGLAQCNKLLSVYYTLAAASSQDFILR